MRRRHERPAFTLFEVILAIALSAALLALIGTAINLYLMRIDGGRNEVEEAQLARTILDMIAADLRATAVYQPQDTSAVAQLVQASAEFDVDSIDEENPSGGGGAASLDSFDSGASGGSDGFSSAFGSGTSTDSGSMGSASGSGAASPLVLPLGLHGNLEELIIDVSRLPRAEELFSTVTGYANAPSPVAATAPLTPMSPAGIIARPSDVKTIRYFVRQGNPLQPGSLAATSLAPGEQLLAGGLVRQEIDRTARTFAEESGNQAVLNANQVLLAPEVVRIEFYYFDGAEVYSVWDMQERGALPLAIEVRLWLLMPDDKDTLPILPNNVMSILANATEYRQTVYLPLAVATTSAAQTITTDSSSTSSSPTSQSSASSSAFREASNSGGPPQSQ